MWLRKCRLASAYDYHNRFLLFRGGSQEDKIVFTFTVIAKCHSPKLLFYSYCAQVVSFQLYTQIIVRYHTVITDFLVKFHTTVKSPRIRNSACDMFQYSFFFIIKVQVRVFTRIQYNIYICVRQCTTQRMIFERFVVCCLETTFYI